ncbi:G-protein coupled receptor Mth2-like isoform X6 [Cylas formicarius]|uniref:G-protein coupled receptor Mth2-like isoform X6 n=1 Tax=Cylas formicarius TaxID=197179 RepID=UPI00295881F8|nr:G-protein coupled receptor Mth2-like isoform X6 [Cylas formicarius]
MLYFKLCSFLIFLETCRVIACASVVQQRNLTYNIRKCCSENQLFINRTCAEETTTKPLSILWTLLLETSFGNSHPEWIFSAGNYCSPNYSALALTSFSFDEDHLVDDEYGVLGNFTIAMYCLEVFFDNLNYSIGAIVCLPDVGNDAHTVTTSLGMIISMPFLLATFLVYALLPDRNLHQKALMFYVLTLFVSYVLLVTINLSDSLVEPGCTLIGYLTLFFFMVSFFWMNVICLDIWFTFSGSRGFVGSKRSSERKRLLIYCGYAWGVPLLLTFTVLLIQTYSDPESQFNPAIGSTKCFLGDGLPNLLYFYGETAILIIINVTLFGLTAYKIRKVKKETSMLKQNDSKRHSYEKDKQKFNLFLKLLFAMGVNWSMEIISWAVNWSTGNTYTAVWYLTDFCNAAYGVFIFFIFVFKKKIWNLLQKRYYTFIGKPHLARTMTTTQSQTTRTSNYSSATYSTADTHIAPDRNNTNGTIPEEVALHRMR